MLDAGAFVGGAARRAARETGADIIAMDLGEDFLRAGQRMEGGDRVAWVTGASHKLPFREGAFNSVWCMDAYIAPREFTRVAAPGATLCLCCEVPVDSRGGLEAFLEEWAELGWELAAHRQLSLEAAQAWRTAEADLVRHRPRYIQRYGERGYVMQLDILGDLVRSYELGEQGHGLFVFSR
jgi:ubiquinone/menaquinone biosynthesis C-methylase UbiE